MGGKIIDISPNGIAKEVGISPGDEIISINGVLLKDIFDYKFLIQESFVKIVVKHKNEIIIYKIEKLPEEDLGITFESPIFDKVKRCQNSCIFCFIDQLPEGLRPSLYLKDDDYRLSFLYGNYITLTNIGEQELDKIVRYRLSPLYISVHSTQDDIRLKLVRNRKTLSLLDKLSYLIEKDIFLNIQIVLIPGINDQDVLEQTILDLFSFHGGIISVAVVPVGLTQYRKGLYPLRKFTKSEMLYTISQIEKFQSIFREKIGKGFVYLADEFYLEADYPLPNINYYDTFSQIEDGVGMSRIFIDEIKTILKKKKGEKKYKKIGSVTGKLGKKALNQIRPYVKKYLPNISLSLIDVENNFFGNSITVTGLLTGRDIINTLKFMKEKFDKILIPDIVLNSNDKFLDDMNKNTFLETLDLPISIIETTPESFLEGVLS